MIQANCMQIASGWAFDMTLNTSRYRYLRRGTVSQIFEVQPSAPFQQSLTGHLFQKVLCLRFHLFIHGLANLRAKQNHRMIYGYHCIEIIDRLILIVIPRAGWYWICWMPYIYICISIICTICIYIYILLHWKKQIAAHVTYTQLDSWPTEPKKCWVRDEQLDFRGHALKPASHAGISHSVVSPPTIGIYHHFRSRSGSSDDGSMSSKN